MTRTTIFIVDDNDDLRTTLVHMVEAEGFAAETYASAQAFLDAGGGGREGCLLVDIHMPGMDGLELQDKLRDDGSTLPIIVITGVGDVTKAVRALKAGAVDFIEKPFQRQEIVASIHQALELGRKARQKADLAVQASERAAQLTPREREVLKHLVIGDANKMIARKLGISPRTVEVHRARVMRKMGARGLPHLVQMALVIDFEQND